MLLISIHNDRNFHNLDTYENEIMRIILYTYCFLLNEASSSLRLLMYFKYTYINHNVNNISIISIIITFKATFHWRKKKMDVMVNQKRINLSIYSVIFLNFHIYSYEVSTSFIGAFNNFRKSRACEIVKFPRALDTLQTKFLIKF